MVSNYIVNGLQKKASLTQNLSAQVLLIDVASNELASKGSDLVQLAHKGISIASLMLSPSIKVILIANVKYRNHGFKYPIPSQVS